MINWKIFDVNIDVKETPLEAVLTSALQSSKSTFKVLTII